MFLFLLKILLLATLFVATGGVVAAEWGKKHKTLAILAAVVATLGSSYLFWSIYKDITDLRRPDLQNGGAPKRGPNEKDMDGREIAKAFLRQFGSKAGPCDDANVKMVPLSSRSACPLSPAEELALEPGDTFRECDDCPEMVVMPKGSLTMGSPAGEEARHNDEEPLHQVTFARPFAVGRFAVTFDEWDACINDGGCNGDKLADNGWGRG